MKRSNVFKVMILVLVLAAQLPLTAGRSPLPPRQFARFILQQMELWNVPGTAVGVIHKGDVILAGGYGYRDIEKKLPVTADTLFAIGSSTKAFTSFTVGLMVDDGKLEWDMPVREYLPDFQLFDAYASQHMTPRDLLIHNSGLPRHDGMWYGSDRSRKELFDALKYLEPSKGFREVFQYQNFMYMTAGYLVGQVSGSTWENVVKKRIFTPLRMANSNFSVAETQKSADFALPYKEKQGRVERTWFYPFAAGMGPAGSINSCANDMLKWLKLHLQKGKWDDQTLINDATLKKNVTPQMLAGGTVLMLLGGFADFSYPTYGMGWFMHHYRGHNIIHHGGNINGFSALVALMPETETGVVVLTNMEGTLMTFPVVLRIFDRVLGLRPMPWGQRFKNVTDQLRKGADDKQRIDNKLQKKGTQPTHPLKTFAGEFKHPGYGTAKIWVKDNTLHAKYNSLTFPLEHFHYNLFKGTEGVAKGLKFHFLVNGKGDIDRIAVPLEPGVDDIIFARAPEKAMMKKEFLQKMVGVYKMEIAPQEITVKLKGETTLVVIIPGQPEYTLVPYKDTTFNLKGLKGFSAEFILDKDGKAVKLISHQPNGDFVANRVR